MFRAMMSFVTIISIFHAFLAHPLEGATIYVPDNYATIQAAVNAAADGDTVVVRPGSYRENIWISRKSITVKSEKGPQATVIDGTQHSSVVHFDHGAGHNPVLDGFTLTNGKHHSFLFGGGGIMCQSSSPTITNNIIIENHSDDGVGIYCEGDSSPVIANNIIANNKAYSTYLWETGGGILCAECSPVIKNNIIFGNEAECGSGMALFDCDAIVTNNVIYGNISEEIGGGICCIDCPNVEIANTILWDNDAVLPGDGPEIYVGASYHTSVVSISYSDLRGGTSSVEVNSGCTFTFGSGMIDVDPLFVGASGGDFHLKWNSPCRDAGDNFAIGIPEHDFEGDPRIAHGAADMGADEFHTHLYYMGKAAPGGVVTLKMTDVPGTAPVMLWLGSGVLDPPIHLKKYGDWYLAFPLLLELGLGAIPGHDGVLALSFPLPSTMPAPLDFPLQGLIGTHLTNLSEMIVQ